MLLKLTYEWYDESETLTANNGLESIQVIHKTVGIGNQECWVVFKHQARLGNVLLNHSLGINSTMN